MTTDESSTNDDHTLPIAIPTNELPRYVLNRDHDREQDIANYVEKQAGETVLHVELVKTEIVLGDEYEVWDVTTEERRWWVLNNLTNLYEQESFRSLDFLLSFHIGLMMRLRSRDSGAHADDQSPFDEVLRRQVQARDRFEAAVEPEDFQSVGMLLREALISLVNAMRRRVEVGVGVEQPQMSNFVAWMELLVNELCPGGTNKQLRHHLKSTAKDAWQLVNWITHDRSANKTATSIAVHSTDAVIGHSIQILERAEIDGCEQCVVCESRDVRSHFDAAIGTDGDYYQTCGVCKWSNHPLMQLKHETADT